MILSSGDAGEQGLIIKKEFFYYYWFYDKIKIKIIQSKII